MNDISSSSFVISGGPASLSDAGTERDPALDVALVAMSALRGPELVFIESNVRDAALLMEQMRAAGKEVYLLDPAQDGLALIASVLEGRAGISALHLVTHGGEGWIDLGSTRLDAATAVARQAELQAIGSHLAADADVLLYGCDVAAGSGPAFVQALAAATGADVAASSDATGAAALGGDWELEVRSGDVEALPAVDASLAELYGHVLALSSVTATFGTGAGNNFTSLGGYNTASQNVAYKVSGDAGYVLNIDGAADGVYGYSNHVEIADSGTETLVTFSFTGGKVFTPSSLLVANIVSNPAQTLVFKGYDGGGGLVATQSLSLGAGMTSGTISFSGFTNIATLKLTATTNSNQIKWISIDDFAFTVIQSPDTTPPTVTGVTSSTANGTYNVGDVIAIQVNFDEAVNVTGTPQITLETGATDRVVSYSSGSGTSTLVFNYTVQAGDTTTDLDYISTAALGLNSGTIKDAAGNNATLTLPAPGAANSLGANKNIVIDGVAPTVNSVTSSAANGSYKAGDTISIQVVFSETVTVTGTPQLTLETGATDRIVNYAGGSGSNTLTFSYTVQAGDTTSDLDYISTGALALNSGTIQDAAGNNATLTLPAPGAAGSLGANKNIVIDTTAPTVTGVSSSTANGSYNAGDVITIQVNFSEAVTVTGTPQLTLETGATDRVVDFTGGSGTSTLTFSYTVQAGDSNADLDYISTAALALNTGTIADAAGNAATLTLPAPGASGSLGANKNIVIDTTAPSVTGVSSSTANGSYNAGDVISIEVNFSEAVTVTGTPQLTLETGATDRIVDFTGGSGTSTLTFSYTVQAGDTSADLDYISTAALALNSGTIADAAGNAASLTLPAPGGAGSLGANKNIVIDTAAPAVTGVTSSTANGSYKAGDVISIQVTFSEAVTVTGTPQLTLETGATDRIVNYSGGSGTNTLTFSYTVQAGDSSSDLDYVGTGALALNSGTIADAAGNAATLTLPAPGASGSLGANKNIVIDGVLPTVTGVTSSTANGSYKAGDVITIEVNFSEAVTVTGTPQLTLETGATDRIVNYSGGSGSSTLTFSYTVQAGDSSADLDYISTSALALNSGTIADAAGNPATLTLPAPGASGSLGANKNLVIDGVLPTVSNVTSSTANGSYKAGDVITIEVVFSEAVTVTGTPQLTLETGSTDRIVNYSGGSGSNTLTFSYTVQAGDSSADLDYISTGALALNSGTIADAAGNAATLTLPAPGAAGSLGANKNIVVDGVVPTVTGVTSSTANGSYNAGDVIAIEVVFSEAVTVTGTPQLTLETGATDRIVNYVSGSGSSTLVFNYTVQAGDTSADLDYISTAALALNSGTIADAAGNAATLTLPAPGGAGSLGASKNIVIDTAAPAVTGVTSSTANGSYKVGDVISIQVSFSEAVTVTGTPQITLETGATDRIVNYASGSGSSTLTFSYTVQAGDSSADLDYIGTSALALNSGTIADAAGNAATLTLPAPGASGSLGANKNIVIDGVVPTVTGVTSSTANGTYKAGDVITIQVSFSESVTVSGTPQLTLETGATDRIVNYSGGSGSNTLTFSYTVQAGDSSADLDYISTSALALNSGTIADAVGNAATLTLPAPGASGSLGANKNLVIDGVLPTVTGVTSSASNGSYKVGDVIAIEVNFSEAVNVTGTPQLTLETGATDRIVNYSGGSGSSTLTFSYTVQAGDSSADLDYISTGALALNSGTIADAAGNAATLTLPAPGASGSLGANKNLVIDGVVPTVTGVTSSTANGSYNAGDVITIQVNFSESVTVSGTPQLTLETGSTDRILNYASGSGSSTLTFSYTVQAGDTSADLDYIGTSALAPNSGTITDAAGNNATLTLPAPGASGSLGANKNIVIDTTVPTVSGVTASTANGAYNAGDVISIEVNFSEAVTVTGTPQLTLETGATDRIVNYASGSGTSTLVFTYTVQAGDTSADLDYTGTSALALNSGTIQDAAGNNATLTLPAPGASGSLGANKNIVIDTTVPTVTGVSSSTANGSYNAGDVISIQVNFSEAVTVTGTPQITLETGGTDRVINYASGSGTSTLTFSYTVQAGDTTADLDYISSGALALNGGTITDAAGNDATLTLAAPGTSGSLGANKAIRIDTTAPVITNVSSSYGNGTYTEGDIIVISVSINEPTTIGGTPQLTLETGATDRVVNMSGYTIITNLDGSGSSTLFFTYTVQAGDESADLDYLSSAAFSLNGGYIRDNAGNDLVLTLPAPGAAGSLGANKNIVIDAIQPAVVGVTSSAANGTYKIGDAISIQVTFSEAVTVSGTPQLTLETGATDRVVNYAGGSGTSTLTFSYTVQAGDSSADLDYIGTGALALNGGTIQDGTGNNALLTLPAPGAAGSLGASKNIVIDGVAPTVSSVSSSTANGAYNAGDVISIQVTFSEAVTVSGTPQLTLETGGTDRVVNYASGSGSSTLTFSYTVQAGDTSADLDYISTGALAFNGSTIVDGAGNSATLTLPAPGAAGSLGANKNIVIDTTPPAVSGVTSSAANGTYKIGDAITIQVNFSEAVTVTGTPQLTLETGATDRVLNYTGGSGTSTLSFSYTVQAGDLSADLDYAGTSALALNGGTIRDAADNGATLTLPTPGAAGSLGANKNLVIDGVVPTVSGVTASSANGTYKLGDVITIQVNFSETVNVTGTPQLTLETGGTDRVISYVGGSGSSTLTFSYTVQAGDESADLDYTGTGALSLNGGGIADTAGNPATLTLPAPGAAGSLGANKNIVVDGIVPTVTGVTSSTANGIYMEGDVITIQVNFSETVNVTGTPQLTLETGGTDRTISYVGGSGSSTLTFSYTVQAGDESADLDYTGTAALAFNGGSITDTAGNIATLTLPAPGAPGSLGANKNIVIDAVPPTVTGVTSSAADGLYNTGDVIAIQVMFSEAVAVTGTPQLTLETGGTDRVLNYTSGSGTSTLTFTYTVQAGDESADLDYLSSAALSFGLGWIRDIAGNEAITTLPEPGTPGSLGANKNIVIDTTPPQLVSAAIDGAVLVLTFTELDAAAGPPAGALAVSVNGKVASLNSVALDNATRTVTLTLSAAVASTDVVLFSYTDPSAGDDPLAIQDAAGNDAASLSGVAVTNNTPPAPPPPNTPGTGGPLVNSRPGQPPERGDTLSFDPGTIVDADGGVLPGSVTYQWLRDGAPVAGATGASYLIGLADVGTQLSLQVNYRDGTNHSEALLLGTAVRTGDGDGSPTQTELLVPRLLAGGLQGDGNGDGLLDAYQAGVVSASVPHGSGSTWITLVADSKRGLIDGTDPNQALVNDFATGLVTGQAPAHLRMNTTLEFSVDVGIPGLFETFSIFVDSDLDPKGIWLQGKNGRWHNVTTGRETVGDMTRLDFFIADGGPFDADGTANGVIDFTAAIADAPSSIVGAAPSPIMLPGGIGPWFGFLF